MNYGNQQIDYAVRTSALDSYDDDFCYADSTQPQYARKRSAKAVRRRGKKRGNGSHPGCGIGGRRNKQYSW